MRTNSLTTSYADVGRLLDALPALCGKAPESLTAVTRAHQRLTTATPSATRCAPWCRPHSMTTATTRRSMRPSKPPPSGAWSPRSAEAPRERSNPSCCGCSAGGSNRRRRRGALPATQALRCRSVHPAQSTGHRRHPQRSASVHRDCEPGATHCLAERETGGRQVATASPRPPDIRARTERSR